MGDAVQEEPMANGDDARNGGWQRALIGVAGSVVTAAIVSGAAFSFSTSRNVAVLTVEVSNVRRELAVVSALETRVRDLELELAVLKGAKR